MLKKKHGVTFLLVMIMTSFALAVVSASQLFITMEKGDEASMVGAGCILQVDHDVESNSVDVDCVEASTATPTATVTVTVTPTATSTATVTAVPTDLPTVTPTNTLTPTTVPTDIPTAVPTETATATATPTAVPTATETATPTATAFVCDGLVQEAEDGTLTGLVQAVNDPDASGGIYVVVPEGSPNQSGYELTDNVAEYCVWASFDDWYDIKVRMVAENIENDSWWVTANGDLSDPLLWDMVRSSVYVDDFVNDRGVADPAAVYLTAGENRLTFHYRESGARLDRFELIPRNGPVETSTPTAVPTGTATDVPTNVPTATQQPTSSPTPTPDGGGGVIPTATQAATPTDVPTATPITGYPSEEVDGWYMAGANAQRTSAVADGPNPRENDFGVKWYRPIEAYMGQHVQLIASRGKVYAATSAGLVALSGADGSLVWRFDTDMPLGHSPTVVGDRLYVGGFDKRVYALDADTGTLLWEFDGAKGGFSTSPVVVDGRVMLGSRDGRFYALSSADGSLLWQYPAAGQDPLAPILYSPVYKDGRVYFAANDNYGYALNVADGSLVWRSEKMTGDGYQSFWPVIYGEYVIFSAAPAYVEGGEPGTRSVAAGDYGWDFVKTLQRDDVYPNGASEVRGADIAEYLEEKPWRRGVIVLNAADGSELTMDLDGDGQPEYAPFMYTGTKSGNRYPPLVINGKLYMQNLSSVRTGWGISRAQLTEWDVGGDGLTFHGVNHAIDEPFADSAGGDFVYSNLCCDRVGAYFSLTGGPSGNLWDYNKTLETVNVENPQSWQYSIAPGYDRFWWESSMYGGLPRLNGGYGGPNAIYHNHTVQNPMVPYNGMLFVHRSNTIIAFGPDAVDLDRPNSGESIPAYEARVRSEHPDLALQPVYKQDSTPRASTLTQADVGVLLDREIEKMLAAGHLRPGYYNGTVAIYREQQNVFENPGETLYALTLAYPHVRADLKPQLKQYIDQHYDLYFGNGMYARTGYANLVAREWMGVPPEVAADMNGRDRNWSSLGGVGWSYPQFNMYAMWEYAKLFYADDPAKLDEIYADAKSRIDTSVPTSEEIKQRAWLLNGYIAGYEGFLALQASAGESSADAGLRTQVSTNLFELKNERVNEWQTDQPYIEVSRGSDYYRRQFSVARNFIYMTPELGEHLRTNGFGTVSAAVAEYADVAPYWVATRYEASVSENSADTLQTHAAMFGAMAYVMQANADELRRYIDAPAFAVGDLFYIRNLALTLNADASAVVNPTPTEQSSGAVVPTATATATAVATATPTPVVNTGEVVQAELLYPVDIEFVNGSYGGNPFDLLATVDFVHDPSGEMRRGEMFYDGDNRWVVRFTADVLGTWRYVTESADGDLDGITGVVTVAGSDYAGFVKADGAQWTRSATGEAFAPQFVMGAELSEFTPEKVDADLDTFMDGHGFDGFHIRGYCHWFVLGKDHCRDVAAGERDPDIETFKRVEEIILQTYIRGGVTHIWMYGDDMRTHNPSAWGLNGVEDRRVQRQLAARLGAMPGWSMGYGYDVFEWANKGEIEGWFNYVDGRVMYPHLLGARGYKNQIAQYTEILGYSAYEQHEPDYGWYVGAIDDRRWKPSFSEDRFRVDQAFTAKDYTFEQTRRGMWHSMMAGGVANIWGNMQFDEGGSYLAGSRPYPNGDELKLYSDFEDDYFTADMSRCNGLSDGWCLEYGNGERFIFYREDAVSISVDLSGMGQARPYVAMNTVTGERRQGMFAASQQVWQAPAVGDWVVVVGEW